MEARTWMLRSALVSICLLATMLPMPCSAGTAEVTFDDLVAGVTGTGTTAQIVALQDRLARQRVGLSVSRLLPTISLSERVSAQFIDEDRYTSLEQTAEECEAERGQPCDVLLLLDGYITLPDQTWSNSLRLTLRQPLLDLGAIHGVHQQEQQRRIADLQGRLQMEGEILELVQAYTDLQYDVQRLELQRRSAELSEETLGVVQTRHGIGEATTLELDQAQLDLDQARLELAQAERSLPRTMATLWETAGEPAGGSLQVCPLMAVDDTGQPLELAGATRTELSSQQVVADRLAHADTVLSWMPTISLTGGLAFSGSGATHDEMWKDMGFNYGYVTGSLSWTPFSGLSAYHRLRSAGYELQKGELEHDRDVRELALQDAELAADLLDLHEDALLLEQQVALKERSERSMSSRYADGGQVPYERELQSRSALENARMQLLTKRRQQVIAMAQRWVKAGQAEEFLDLLSAAEGEYASGGRCQELSRE